VCSSDSDSDSDRPHPFRSLICFVTGNTSCRGKKKSLYFKEWMGDEQSKAGTGRLLMKGGRDQACLHHPYCATKHVGE
jgi:hypothetical protein